MTPIGKLDITFSKIVGKIRPNQNNAFDIPFELAKMTDKFELSAIGFIEICISLFEIAYHYIYSTMVNLYFLNFKYICKRIT